MRHRRLKAGGEVSESTWTRSSTGVMEAVGWRQWGGACCALLPILQLHCMLVQLLLGCLGMCLPLLLHQMKSASVSGIHIMLDLHQAVLQSNIRHAIVIMHAFLCRDVYTPLTEFVLFESKMESAKHACHSQIQMSRQFETKQLHATLLKQSLQHCNKLL